MNQQKQAQENSYIEPSFNQADLREFMKLIGGLAHEPSNGSKQASGDSLAIGSLIPGTIVAIDRSKGFAIIDANLKAEARVPLADFADSENIEVGQRPLFVLEAFENNSGDVVLSRSKAARKQALSHLLETHSDKENNIIEATPFKMVRGGFLCRITNKMGTIDAFLPMSHVDPSASADPTSILMTERAYKIIKIDVERQNIVLSARELRKEIFAEHRKIALERLKEGDEAMGRVKNITDFGVFVDLGGIDGLLHVSDMCWVRSPIGSDAPKYKVNDEIRVKVITINQATQRIALSVKHMEENPWTEIKECNPNGTRVKASVKQITQKGIIAQIEAKKRDGSTKTIWAFLHCSEISWVDNYQTKLESFKKMDEEFDAAISSIDIEFGRATISVKALDKNPWEDVEKHFPKDGILSGQCSSYDSYGVSVSFPDTPIKGYCSINEYSWLETPSAAEMYDRLKKLDPVSCKMLGIDRENCRISLSIKQTVDSPWGAIETALPKNSDLACNFVRSEGGAYLVSIPALADVEKSTGLAGISNLLARIQMRDVPQGFVPEAGKPLPNAWVVSVDKEAKLITLSCSSAKVGAFTPSAKNST